MREILFNLVDLPIYNRNGDLASVDVCIDHLLDYLDRDSGAVLRIRVEDDVDGKRLCVDAVVGEENLLAVA